MEERNIDDILKENFLNYSVSIITGRSIPDIRDGLKVVQRRIMYIMYQLKTKGFTKVAKVSGLTTGGLHPHGSASVDAAIIRLNQEFTLNAPLLDPQGNFGSVEGDEASAARYIETRISKFSRENLVDNLDDNSVDYVSNYDGTMKEPTLLPAKVNLLLINGASGIASGFSTDIPPNNLAEVCNATIAYINEGDKFDVFKYIKGPDLPSGGIIDSSKIKEAYKTGNGSLTIQAKIVEENDGLAIVELPYMLKVEDVVDKIANNENIDFVSSVRNEGANGKIRIKIFLKRGTDPNYAKNRLFKFTPLQYFVKVNLVSIFNNNLVIDGIATYIKAFVEFRFETKTRIFKYKLKELTDEEHILLGLLTALDYIDELITIIKASSNRADAKANILKEFEFSSIQVDKILDMRLSKITNLESIELENRLKEVNKEVARLNKLLKNPKLIYAEMINEQTAAIKAFAKPRRTAIKSLNLTDDKPEDIIENKDFYIMMTKDGFVKKLPESSYSAQKRAGKGKNVGKMHANDVVMLIKRVENHDNVLCFTNIGLVHKIKVWDIKESSLTANGFHINNYLSLDKGEIVVSTLFLSRAEFEHPTNGFIFATKKGLSKMVELSEFTNIPQKGGIIATRIKDKDELKYVKFYNEKELKGKALVVLASDSAKVLIMPISELTAVKRPTFGYTGMKFNKEDKEIISLEVVPSSFKGNVVIISESGKGKKTGIDKYPLKKRANMGVLSMRVTPNDPAKCITLVEKDSGIIIASKEKVIMVSEDSITEHVGRITKGITLIDLDKKDSVQYMNKEED